MNQPINKNILANEMDSQKMNVGKQKTAKEFMPITLMGIRDALYKAQSAGYQICLDTFRQEVMYKTSKNSDWQRFKDNDYTKLRLSLEKNGLKKVGKEDIKDMVMYFAEKYNYDSAILWINEVVPKWDGIARIETFLPYYFGADDSLYTRACSRYLWSSLAGRIMKPGVKADMVIVLIGDQGCGKSTGVEAISPDPDFFTQIDFNDKDADQARKMLGRLVGEISELKGLRTKDEESIKSLVTRTHDEWIKKFKEFPTIYARRITFIGTTNENNFLSDITGNRRWLPIKVSKVKVESIKADRLQLYAEAREKYLLNGIEYTEAEELAKEVIKDHLVIDPWFEVIVEWLDGKSAGTQPENPKRVSTRVVLKYALGIDDSRINKHYEHKVVGVLKILGYVKKKERTGNFFVLDEYVDSVDSVDTEFN